MQPTTSAMLDPSAGIEKLGKAVDRNLTSDHEREIERTKRLALRIQDRKDARDLEREKLAVDKELASHPDWFVAGSRPAMLWSAVAMAWIGLFYFIYHGDLDIEVLGWLLGLLGLPTVSARTIEKIQGVARHNLRKRPGTRRYTIKK